MPSGTRHIVFPTSKSIEKDWETFIRKYDIEDPDQYLEAAYMPYGCLNSLQIGITTVCNFNCPMCFNHYDTHYKYYTHKKMSVTLVERFARKNAPIKDLVFSVSGEPFVHPELFQMMDRIRPFVETFSFSTNGSLITPDKAEQLKAYPIGKLYVSTDGSDKETYEKYRLNGDFQVFIRNAESLVKNFGEKVVFAATVFFENSRSILNMPKLCHQLGIKDLLTFKFFDHPKALEKNIRKLKAGEMRRFMLAFLEACDRYNINPCYDTRAVDFSTAKYIQQNTNNRYSADLSVYQSACSLPFHMMLIDGEANYNFCCAMEPIPGDALRTPVRELYNAKVVRMMRVLNLLGKFPMVCKKYCSKMDADSQDYSLSRLKTKIKYEQYEDMQWQVVEHLHAGGKAVVLPFGTMTKTFLASPLVNGADIVAVADRNHKRLTHPAGRFPLVGYEDLKHFAYDTIVITSGAYWREILSWFEENDTDFQDKRLYRIDIHEKKLRYIKGRGVFFQN